MANRIYRPTFASFWPATSVGIGQLFLTAVFWLGYTYRPLWWQLGLAIVVTLLQLRYVYLPTLATAIMRVVVTPYAIEARGMPRATLFWRDVHQALIYEKYRPWRNTRRTDRMVILRSVSGAVLVCHPSAWPQVDEDEFLATLAAESMIYGFELIRQTTRI